MVLFLVVEEELLVERNASRLADSQMFCGRSSSASCALQKQMGLGLSTSKHKRVNTVLTLLKTLTT